MKTRNYSIFLLHIVDSIEKIQNYLNGKSREDFLSNDLLQDGVLRNFEIIGEATKNLPESFRSLYPDIQWKSMAGFRDILIHQYFGIDLDMVWNITQTSLPEVYSKIIVLQEYADARNKFTDSL